MTKSQLNLLFGVKGEQFCKRLLHVKRRFPKLFPLNILREVGQFVACCSRSLLEKYTVALLSRILFAHYRLLQSTNSASKYKVDLRILEINPSTIGIAIAVNSADEFEALNESKVVNSVQCLIPGMKHDPDSFFSYVSGSAHLFYLEIKKLRGGFFSHEEKKKLRLELAPSLQQKFERSNSHLVIPGNEEELFKNICRLRQEITSIDDLTEVMTTFVEYSHKSLKFLITVIRVVQPQTPKIVELSAKLPSLIHFSLESVLTADRIGKKHFKEVAIFTLEMSSSSFLRGNSDLDLRKARQYIVKVLENMLGPFRDFNGGLLIQENEQLLTIKSALGQKGFLSLPLFEDLFYGIKPITMRALLSVETGVELATLFRKLIEHPLRKDQKYYSECFRSDEVHVIGIKTREIQWKTSLPLRVLGQSVECAHTCLEYEGLLYICFFHQYPQNSLLIDVVQKELNDHQLFKKHLPVLRLNFQAGDPPSLNPRLATDIHCHTLCNFLFEGLTRINQHGEAEPAAAERITVSSNRTSYVFHLRPSCWSNGEKVTAYHFENAWKKAILANSAFCRFDLFSPIKNAVEAKEKMVSLDQVGVMAKDANTLCVELETPCSHFLNLVASPAFSPLLGDSEEPIHFNGPFMLAEWNRDSDLYLSQNPFYWGAPRINLGGIKIFMIRDALAAYQMFLQGELDIIGDPTSPLPQEVLKQPKIQKRLLYKPISRVFWIHFNTHIFPYHNVHLRQALSLALNRKELTEKVFFKQAPHLSPFPPKYASCEESLEGNPEKAFEYFEIALKELKVSRENFPPLCIIHSNLSFEKPLINELKKQWEKVLKVSVTSRELSWSEFSAALDRGDYQIGGLFRRDIFNHPNSYLCFFNKSLYNPYGANNEKFTKLLDDFNNEKDPKRSLKKIEAILVNEAPVVSLVTQRYVFLVNERIQGIDWNENGCLDITMVRIDEKNSKSNIPSSPNIIYDIPSSFRKTRTRKKVNS